MAWWLGMIVLLIVSFVIVEKSKWSNWATIPVAFGLWLGFTAASSWFNIWGVVLLVVSSIIANMIVGESSKSNWNMIPVTLFVCVVLAILIWWVKIALHFVVPLIVLGGCAYLVLRWMHSSPRKEEGSL